MKEQISKELEELRRSRDVLKLLIDSLPDPTIMIDMNCRVLFANKAVEKLCGKDPVAEHLYCYQAIQNFPRPCDEIYPGECPCGLKQAVSAREVARATQIWFNESKSPIHMDVICAPIIDEKGEMILAVESYRDITKYKLEQEELQRLVIELREALVKHRKK